MAKKDQDVLVDTKNDESNLFVTIKDDTNKKLDVVINTVDVNEGNVGGNPYLFQEIVLLKDQTIKVYDVENDDYKDKEITENKPAVLKFSSKRLKNALINNKDKIEDVPIQIERYGEGFDTHYKIRGTESR